MQDLSSHYTEKRKRSRIPLELRGEITLPDSSTVKVLSDDISFCGIRFHAYYDEETDRISKHLHLQIGLRLYITDTEQPVFIDFQGILVRARNNDIGVDLIGISLDSYESFKNLMINHADEPDRLLAELGNRPGLAIDTVDIQLLKTHLSGHIREAVQEIANIYFATSDISVDEIYKQPNFEPYSPPSSAMTAIVGYTGAIRGGIHLSSNLQTALKLAGHLADERFNDINESVIDSFGEIANMIAGGIQTRLSKDLENIDLTPPEIIFGSDYGIRYSNGLSSISEQFTSSFGSFTVECFFSG
ncbi:MAG: chemotaxis protein CheX [Magnetococcales bacterium]|nr:chemotaxis protein CheX [Magnetococcales bacterium]